MHSNRRQFTRSALLATAGGMLLPPSLWTQTITYKVKKGDTLGKIALRLNTSTNELKRANNLNSDLIQVGQKLTIPTGNNTNIAGFSPIAMSNYIVVKGDTLSKIAARHGISIRELKAMNNLNRDLILVGQNLRIPANATRQTLPTEDLMAKVRASTARIKIHRDKWQHIIVHHSAIKYGNVEKYDAAHRLRRILARSNSPRLHNWWIGYKESHWVRRCILRATANLRASKPSARASTSRWHACTRATIRLQH